MTAPATGNVDSRLLEAFRSGEWLELGPDVPADDPSAPRLPAGRLRDLLLGIHADARAGGRGQVALRVRGALIEGSLDLRECSSVDGGPLPPILLERCLLLGDPADPRRPVIDAAHARLGRLSLAGSRLGLVDLQGASISGDFDISDVAPADSSAACQVSARQCRIGGELVAHRARLRIPALQKNLRLGGPDFALNMAGATIGGSVLLQPGFEANGGVNLGGARVAGDIWAESAVLTASDRTAFRGQTLRCEGVLALRGLGTGVDDALPCQVSGKLDLMGVELGHLDLRGLRLCAPPNAAPGALEDWAVMLDMAKVRGHLLVSDAEPPLQTVLDGPLRAIGGEVGRDVHLSGLRFARPGSHAAQVSIDLQDLQVGGSVLAYEVGRVSIDLTGCRIGHRLEVHGLEAVAPQGRAAGFLAANVDIGMDCDLQRVSGAFDLQLARVGGALKLAADRLSAFDAKDAEVRGSVCVAGTVRPSGEGGAAATLRFDGGSFLGEFRIGAPDSPLGFEQSSAYVPSISIEDARIERDFHVSRLGVERVSLPDWARQPPIEARSAPLSCYPGWTLHEALCPMPDGRAALVAWLAREGASPVLLDGRSAPIHALNATGALSLSDPESVAEYLRFFCAWVWSDGWAFQVVERDAALLGATLDRPVALAPVRIEEDGPGKGWILGAFIRHDAQLFQARFRVSAGGAVEMLEDESVAGVVADPMPVSFAAPVRLIATTPGEAAAPFLLPFIAAEAPRPAAEGATSALRALGERAGAGAGSEGAAHVSLRGLRAGALRFDPDGSWGRGVVLDLDGFEYGRVELERARRSAAEAFSAEGREGGRSGPRAGARGRLRRGPRRAAAHEPYLEWLALQYAGARPNQHQYAPQPYEQLSRVLRNHGNYEEAKRVTLEKLSLERRFVHRWWIRPWLWVMEKAFDHGLFATRAVVTFLSMWLAGTLAFHLANAGRLELPLGDGRAISLPWPRLEAPVLVVDPVAVSSLVLRGDASADRSPSGAGPAMQLARNPEDVSTEIPCADQVEPLWYALDVFVPLLDLRQEDKCSITSRGDAWPWRAFKAIYAVAGAIVTSLMLLTVSGVLRRRVEQ